MPKKLTQEEVEKIFLDEGCSFDDVYINSITPHNYTCKCGNKSKIRYSNFQQNKRCAICAGNQKLTQEKVFNIYKDGGYTLRSEYKNCDHKDELTCPKGHELEMTLSNFKYGYKCAECAGNKPFTHEHVFNYYKDHGYILESEYKGVAHKDELICPNGHKIYMTFNDFKNQETRCGECSRFEQKLTHEFVENYYKERGYTLLTQYVNNSTKNTLLCPKNHKITMTFNNFKNIKQRCGKCYRENNRGENHPNWNPDREEIDLNSRIRGGRSKVWIINNMKDDPNYNNFIKNPNDYVVDHIIPVKLFCKLYTKYNLDETEVRKVINKRINLQLLTQKQNSDKNTKGSIKEAKQFLSEHGIQLED